MLPQLHIPLKVQTASLGGIALIALLASITMIPRRRAGPRTSAIASEFLAFWKSESAIMHLPREDCAFVVAQLLGDFLIKPKGFRFDKPLLY